MQDTSRYSIIQNITLLPVRKKLVFGYYVFLLYAFYKVLDKNRK